MSMRLLTVLQVVWISLAYGSIVFLWPWLLFHRKLQGIRVPTQVMMYVVFGNFYFINLVLGLQLLHISNRFTLILGALAPFLIGFIRYRKMVLERLNMLIEEIQYFLQRKIGIKTLLMQHLDKRKQRFSKWVEKWILPHRLEIALFVIAMGFVLVMNGTNTLQVYGYTSWGMIVHNYWINAMDANQIFIDGIYPFGLDSILYYLHVVFQIPTYVLIRLIGLIQVMMIHLMVLLFLKVTCRSTYTPYIGIMVYPITKFFYQYAYFRYFGALPQEYGLIFLWPTLYFLLAPLRNVGFKERYRGHLDKIHQYFFLAFGAGVAITLATNFYNLVILFLMVSAVAIGFGNKFFNWKNLKSILLASGLGLLVGIFPLVSANGTGTIFNPSLYLGIDLVTGALDADSTIYIDLKTKLNEEGAYISKETSDNFLEDVVLTMQENVTNQSKSVALMMLFSIVLVLILGIVAYFKSNPSYGSTVFSIALYMIFLCCLQTLFNIGHWFPLEVSPWTMYVGNGIAITWSVGSDALLLVLLRKKATINRAALIELLGSLFIVAITGIRSPGILNAFESNEAIICLTNILQENEGNTSWTICSVNDERLMLWGRGYHYELITFLRDQQNWNEESEILIPTDTVYFFIEKKPNVSYVEAEPRVSIEGASLPLPSKETQATDQASARWIMMSHMYAWAQAFQKLYPYEMEVYYETDDFICYRIYQDGYNLYNFAIDYGYNT